MMSQTQLPSNLNTIHTTRFQKEIELIKQKHEFDIKELPNRSRLITFYMNISKLESVPLVIHIPKQYPFLEPRYTFQPPEGYLSKDSYGIKKPISVLLGQWNVGMRLSNIADNATEEIKKGLVKKNMVNVDQMYDAVGETRNLVLLILFSVFVRVLVGLGSYSGEGHPPEFGDFEAQRNWMSISWNRPLKEWYNEPAEKPWWRLDYPPVAGYLSYICAIFMRFIHPQGLQQIRGYEQLSFKSFMRMTVLFTDIITFFLPIILYHYLWKVNQNVSRLQGILILLLPPFILIDHGHFQYNCIMIGLVLGAYLALIHNHKQWTCVLFTIALSTKQMSMYYALGFFAILLGKALHDTRILNSNTFKFNTNPISTMRFLVEVGKYGVIVIVVTLVLWSPWISFETPQLILQPLQAIFPVHRGLYQLKVPNFWCVTDVFMKWETKFSNNILVIFCGFLSLIGSLPSIVVGIVAPNKQKLTLLVFLNISLCFFFFSYHVHQKTILVPLIFVGLTLHMFGKFGLDFVIMSSFVMYHLLRQDDLVLQYFVCNIAFLYFTRSSITTLHQMAPVTYQKSQFQTIDNPIINLGNQIIESFSNIYNSKLRKVVYFSILFLHFCDAFLVPPEKLPYLFHLLFSTTGFIFFFTFWIISNIRMVVDAIHIVIVSQKKKTE